MQVYVTQSRETTMSRNSRYCFKKSQRGVSWAQKLFCL